MGWDIFQTIVIRGNLISASRVLENVPTWPRWDVDLDHAELDGGAMVPAMGVKGKLHMKNGKTFPFEFVDVSLNRVAYRTVFPGCKLDWYWAFPQEKVVPKERYELRMGVEASGTLSFAYGWLLKNQCKEAFEKCTPLFKQCAEEEENK